MSSDKTASGHECEETPFFSAQNVWKIFGGETGRDGNVDEWDAEEIDGVVAVRDFNLEVSEGEFVSIVGRSGCGKTTFLNMAAGFERPTRGEIRLHGHPISNPDRDRGVVFQEHALFPWLPIWKNVAFGPSLHGTSRDACRGIADEYLELVGLSGFQERYPDELSGGMRQRVALARVLANDPAVLLMDEPFGALDVFTRESMQEELTRIWQATRKTVLFITHSVEEACVLSDRVVVMTPHPGSIRDVVDVNLPRPRSSLDESVMNVVREIYGHLESG